MNVFISLTNGHGTVQVELRLSLAGQEEAPLFRLNGNVPFGGPNEIGEFNFEIRNFVFPQFGTYRFEVRSGPEYVGGRPFLVIPSPSKS